MVKCKENEVRRRAVKDKEKDDIWPGQIKKMMCRQKQRVKWKEAMEFMFQDTVESNFNVQHFSAIIKQTTTQGFRTKHV